jgi:hypothetical protein
MEKTVAIYGCGGTGINLVSKLMKKNLAGLAPVKAHFLDTSRSNFGPNFRQEDCYIIPGATDGSGKDRAKNYPAISRAISDILVTHPSEELNVLVFSAGGGSGSVIGPKVAEELFRQGKPTIIFLVGSAENSTTTTNTMNTWQTLHGVAKNQNATSVVFYEDNGAKSQDDDVDNNIVTGLLSVLDLYSGDHDRLDSSDIHRFFQIKNGPSVALLDITPDYSHAKSLPYPLAVAALHGSIESSTPSIPADYGCEGYRRQAEQTNLYFVTYTQDLPQVIEELKKVVSNFEALAKARAQRDVNVLDTADLQDDGFKL